MKPMTGIICMGHLGLGDHIILNAVYRSLAAEHELVCIPVKHHNVPSVQFMLRDVDNIVIRPVEDDEDARFFRCNIWKGEALDIGCWSWQEFDEQNWDESFYKQAGLSFDRRWSDWKCDRQKEKELQSNWPAVSDYAHTEYAFVHHDVLRNITIKPELWRKILPLKLQPLKAGHIFQYWRGIELASEIHCICSSFSLFIDSIPLPNNPKLFLHAYARPGEPLPKYRHNWEILK